MNKKIFLTFSFCLILFCSFFFVPVNSAYASTGQTYTYSGEVSSDSSNLGNYAIESVESLNVEGTYVYKVVFGLASTGSDLTIRFLFSQQSSAGSQSGNYFFCNYGYLQNSQFDCNLAIRCTSSTTGMTYNMNGSSAGKINGTTYYYRSLVLTKGNTFELYYSTLSFGGTYSNMTFGLYTSANRFFTKIYDNANYDLNSFIDMDSNTNFSMTDIDFSFTSSDSNKISYYLNCFPFGQGGGLTQNIISYSITLATLANYTPCNSSYANGSLLEGSSVKVSNLQFAYLWSVNTGSKISTSTEYSKNIGLYFSNFYFQINRPVYRTNNTLIIYNFDYYNFLSYVNLTTYQLQKGSDYYNISYSGDLPNSYFIYVYNNDISNMIFDQYIYFYLSTSRIIYFDSAVYLNNDIFLGFDFNFTYYNNPLVTSNGSFNYTFEKPSYVDMPFSLIPLYLPILEAIENGLIFLMFYCPITSHILSFIHLDEFFGALFNVFSFSNGGISILGINLGSFIWACVSFVIFFMLLRSFMPMMWGSIKATSSELYNKAKYNKRRYKEEYNKWKKETKYENYAERRFNKDKQKGKFRNFGAKKKNE